MNHTQLKQIFPVNQFQHLPGHGRIDCNRCFAACEHIEFDKTKRTDGNWRITANPMAWGNEAPEIIVLGFSKGPTQAEALAKVPHDEIAYKGSRGNIGKILKHVGLLPQYAGEDLGQTVSRFIADRNGRFHFGSLIRCTVEQYINGVWIGSGGGMLDKFIATSFGKEITTNCTNRFLNTLPVQTKLIVMFGMGTKLNYVRESFELFKTVRAGDWTWINDVAYTDGKVTVVHVEHFASQGILIPEWLGVESGPRQWYGKIAAEAIAMSGVKTISMLMNIDSAMASEVTANISTGSIQGIPIKNASHELATPVVATIKTRQSQSLKISSDITQKEESTEAQTIVIAEVQKAGYTAIKDIKKFTKFEAPNGQIIYLVKKTTTLNRITVMVNPGLKRDTLINLDGVGAVSDEYRFHSNMNRFPKKILGGKTETTYGWQLTVNSIASLPRFLSAFANMKL